MIWALLARTHPRGGEQIAGFPSERRPSCREKQTKAWSWFDLPFTGGCARLQSCLKPARSTIVLILHSLSKHSLQTLGMFLFCYVAETFYVVYIVLMEHGIFLKATYNTHFCVCVLPGVNKTITLMTFLQLQTVVSPLLRCFLVNLWPPSGITIGITIGRFRAVVLNPFTVVTYQIVTLWFITVGKWQL